MKTIQLEIIPASFTIKDVDTLLYALETRIKAREIMNKEEAAAYLSGISVRMLERLSKDDIIPCHYVPGTSIRVWLKSELVGVVKTWGSKRIRKKSSRQ
ncbi:hypothetical protein KK083_15255 [Fulvivirgaceae bacterium PWU4]|uniref:Uncharacterized protein n=1 Tax=Chryseosolibacter histidini TaxID=2782349 RepID=A0AAP2DQ29_9BACT|nr:hypothetical protein [Chryseosolibacter histidini]MBT1698249.1 hypothetical protein [Chryseosolibacter histidini]